jgi:peptidoglycan/xylan/chitin deacetylase (PgdA/CDA1 family)
MVPTLVPILTGASALAAGAASLYYATYGIRSQWLGPTCWRGRTDTAEVALTFDDGPGPHTERVLEELASLEVRATFFVLGRQVHLYPETVRRIVAQGHEIGNHSYSHPIYLYRTPRETLRQLALTQDIVERVTGQRPRLSRPPCGVKTPAYFAAARRLGLRTVQWDAAGFDWKRIGASEIVRRVLRDVGPGSIILLHDGGTGGADDRRETAAALPLLIKLLGERGLRVAPLSRLLTSAEQSVGLGREIASL